MQARKSSSAEANEVLNGAALCERGIPSRQARNHLTGRLSSRLRERVEKESTEALKKSVDDSGAANIIRDPNAAGTSSAASVLEN